MYAFRDSAFSGGATRVWRLQEVGEGFQRSVGNVMFDALGVGFSNFSGNTEGNKEVHDEPVGGSASPTKTGRTGQPWSLCLKLEGRSHENRRRLHSREHRPPRQV
jgi:hypothetical protein